MSTNGPPDLLRLRNINTYYGQIHILENLELNVREGELVSLLGGNASGKSTTLKTILGLVRPREGSVEFRGEGTIIDDPAKLFTVATGVYSNLDVRAGLPAVLPRTGAVPCLVPLACLS